VARRDDGITGRLPVANLSNYDGCPVGPSVRRKLACGVLERSVAKQSRGCGLNAPTQNRRCMTDLEGDAGVVEALIWSTSLLLIDVPNRINVLFGPSTCLPVCSLEI